MTSFLLGHCPGHFLFIYLFLNHFWATISRAHYSFQRKVILKLHQVKGNDILFSVMPYRHVEEYARYQGDERRAQLTSLFKTGELEELFMFWTVKIIGKVGLIVIFLEVWYSFWWNIWHPDSISSGTHIPVNWIWDSRWVSIWTKQFKWPIFFSPMWPNLPFQGSMKKNHTVSTMLKSDSGFGDMNKNPTGMECLLMWLQVNETAI